MTLTKPFRILVGCKRVIDYAVRIRVKADGSGVEKVNVKHSINPFDEIALEESLRLKEKLGPNIIKEVVALSCGPKQCQETLRTALAMGVDRAIHVEHENETDLQPIVVARVFEKILKRENDIGIVLLGKQAIDDDAGQTGQIIGGLLGWPQATFASKVEIQDDRAKIIREVENGLERVSTTLPVIITTDLRLNEPRYATLQNIMKAKGKPLQKETLDSLGVKISPALTTIRTAEPTKRKAGVMLQSVDDLVSKIKELQ
jgi:electron transfer flavoprotein beta subunit